MPDICPICNQPKYSWTTRNGVQICMECYDSIEKKEILDKASESQTARFFKEWSSKDRTTAFFEAFTRYQKEPNKRDLDTIKHIFSWASHADHGLSKTISYVFNWTKFNLYKELKKF